MRNATRVSLGIVAALAVVAAGLLILRQTRASHAEQVRSRAAIPMQTCSAGFVSDAQCGQLEVFEDRATRRGRRISIHFAVLTATGLAAPDPVFVLAGGPGQSAIDMAYDRSLVAALRPKHDLVLVDQRGTGRSNGLRCDLGDDPSDLDTFFGPLFPLDLVRECRQHLEQFADLRQYTTSVSMDDLDDIRAALGYGNIDLLGLSYGTIAAMEYLRRHGEHVRAVFLVGTASPAAKQPLLFARAAQAAADRMFEDCAADPACHATFPNLRQEFYAVLDRFRDGPIEVTMQIPPGVATRTVKLDRAAYVEKLRLLLYATLSASRVPLLVHRAFLNDFAPLEQAAIHSNPAAGDSRGMYMTVTCSEGVPFISEEDISRETQGTFVGESRVREHIAACANWPRGAVPLDFLEPIHSAVPVLMISGEADGATLPDFGATLLRGLRNGKQVRIREYGHQMNGNCVIGIMQKFIESGSTAEIETGCTRDIRRPEWATHGAE